MFYLTGYLHHAASIQSACAVLGITARMNLADFALELSGPTAMEQFWNARFVGGAQGRLAYIDRMTPSTRGFAGWLPYAVRRWKLASSKSEFKHHASVHSIPTPAACTDPSAIGGPFLIKKSKSSFGEGIRGPFLRFESGEAAHALQPGEYYENFILGHIVKAWYWGASWCVVEIRQPPFVTGNGRSSFRDLILTHAVNAAGAHDWEALECLARYGGLTSLDDVPGMGREVLVDFRYASPYEARRRENRNAIDSLRGSPLAAQFEQAGEVFSRGIDGYASPSLFTVDAMIDRDGKAWFLEMNSNPMVHPDAYPRMLRDATQPAA